MSSNKKILYANLGIYVILCTIFCVLIIAPSDKAGPVVEEVVKEMTVPVKEILVSEQTDTSEQRKILPKGVLPININAIPETAPSAASSPSNTPVMNSPAVRSPISSTLDKTSAQSKAGTEKKALLMEDKEISQMGDTRYVSVKDVEAALIASKSKSPQVYEDALRVWKNFSGKTEPHYSYRYWARDLVLWLRSEKKYTFENQNRVGSVFKILLEKGLISPKAAVLLTTDVWNYFVFREGIPDLDAQLPGYEKKRRAPQSALDSNRDIAT